VKLSIRKKHLRRRFILTVVLLFSLIVGGFSFVSMTHKPHKLWTWVAPLYVKPPPASVTAHEFTTLPPGATLPSEQECASRVHRSSWEPRPDNAAANHRLPTEKQLALLTPWDERIGVDPKANALLSQIKGNFRGTTNEILKWAACKWGIDDYILHAETIVESNWDQKKQGDYTNDRSNCPPDVWDGTGCYQSYGLLQIKYYYNQSAWPMSRDNSAFSVQYALGVIRTCFEGWTTYLNNFMPLPGYARYHAGDIWGCLGRWYSGGWYNQEALDYIQKVKAALAKKEWLEPDFF
jgi:hypothetical protein